MQGLVVTGVSFYLQAWCIERRGPVFLAMVVVIAASPIPHWLRRNGVPDWLATTALILHLMQQVSDLHRPRRGRMASSSLTTTVRASRPAAL